MSFYGARGRNVFVGSGGPVPGRMWERRTDCSIPGCIGVDGCPIIPAVHEWGQLAMTLLILIAGSMVLRTRIATQSPR
jgi:hypothetical protein